MTDLRLSKIYIIDEADKKWNLSKEKLMKKINKKLLSKSYMKAQVKAVMEFPITLRLAEFINDEYHRIAIKNLGKKKVLNIAFKDQSLENQQIYLELSKSIIKWYTKNGVVKKAKKGEGDKI